MLASAEMIQEEAGLDYEVRLIRTDHPNSFKNGLGLGTRQTITNNLKNKDSAGLSCRFKACRFKACIVTLG